MCLTKRWKYNQLFSHWSHAPTVCVHPVPVENWFPNSHNLIIDYVHAPATSYRYLPTYLHTYIYVHTYLRTLYVLYLHVCICINFAYHMYIHTVHPHIYLHCICISYVSEVKCMYVYTYVRMYWLKYVRTYVQRVVGLNFFNPPDTPNCGRLLRFHCMYVLTRVLQKGSHTVIFNIFSQCEGRLESEAGKARARSQRAHCLSEQQDVWLPGRGKVM